MATPADPGGPPPAPEGPQPAGAEPESEEQAWKSRLEPYLRILRRMVRSVTSLFRAHAMIIQDEAQVEAVRVVTGIALIIGAVVFFAVSGLFAGITAFALIQRLTGLPFLESIAIVLGGTVTLALSLAFLAWLRLRKPLLPKSRKLLKSTYDGIMKG